MGNRHGRLRVHGRDVSLLRRAAGHRSALAGGRLHLWLPAASGSIAGRLDEVTGKNFEAACIQRSAAAVSGKTRRSADMKITRGHSEGIPQTREKSKNPAIKPYGNAPGS